MDDSEFTPRVLMYKDRAHFKQSKLGVDMPNSHLVRLIVGIKDGKRFIRLNGKDHSLFAREVKPSDKWGFMSFWAWKGDFAFYTTNETDDA